MFLDVQVEVVFAALFGLLIGSFLNVCIYRLPLDLSIVSPRSFCPNCNAAVSAWENVPLVSYLFLRGKCRHCRNPISIRYPLVELSMALLFAWFVARSGLSIAALRDCTLSALLLALIFTDLETRILPESLTVGGIVLGPLFALGTPMRGGTAALLGLHGRWASLEESVAGILIPAAPLWATGWLFEKIRKKQGLGFGDVVMIAEIGAFLGIRGALLTLLIASLSGSIIGIAYIVAKRESVGSYELPLGSFLGVAGIFVAAFGQQVVGWYEGLLS